MGPRARSQGAGFFWHHGLVGRSVITAAAAAVAVAVAIFGVGCAPSGPMSGTSTSSEVSGGDSARADATSKPSLVNAGWEARVDAGGAGDAGSAGSAGDAGAALDPSSAAPPAGAKAGGPGPPFTPDEVETFLFPTNTARIAPEVIACRAIAAPADRVRCMIGHVLKADPIAVKAAIELYDRTGNVIGLEVEQTMNGGYRGMLHLVPEAPVLAQRKHLEWVTLALYDFETFFQGLTAAAAGAAPVRYRVRPLALRFFRSVKARSPTAFAYDWTVAYNLAGSLNLSADAVRETMFHEIFHLNDKDHKNWSVAGLGAIYIDIVAKCGTKVPCLAPYAPSETLIRGGTYYAFHPENGVVEYGAELALRYYREQRAVLQKRPLKKPPFKCGPSENARAWALIAAEFFGGVDLVPPCEGPSR
jgi:hypothetical protein